MKKSILKAAAALLMAATMQISAYAVPALPRLITVKQSDGSTITIQIHGDEKFHYTTTSDGYLVVQKNGVYYHATADASGLRVTDIKANDPSKRSGAESDLLFFKSKGIPQQFKESAIARLSSSYKPLPLGQGLNTGFPTKGEIRTLVLLVNFKDQSFESETAQQDFHNLLNEEGYSQNGATGSAKDYYLQNSNYQFNPTFDVYGPVTLSHDTKYYGENDKYGIDSRAEEMIAEACRLAHDNLGVNFANYDLNNDGIVDNVFVFYAGNNEAEGGGADKIWPHRSEISEELVLDGKRVCVYACSSEINLAGYSPKMAGIGTFCHEFGHVLGWADIYDTDGAANGNCEGVWDWSIMCSGSYNNQGRTPPAVSATARYMVGWLEPEELYYTGNYTLESLEKSNKAYIIRTDTEGEYFMLENRQNTSGWDKYLKGHGLMIFHVDRSERLVAGVPAIDRWDWNTPNCVASHQCYRIITARPNSGDGYQAYMPFPGASNNREFTALSNPENSSWSGAHVDAELFNITEENGKITFRVITSNEERINVESVEINGRNSMIINDTIQFRAIITPDKAYNKNVKWESSNPSVATIDENGLAKAVKEGTTTIKVTTEDGGHTDEKQLKVIDGQIFRARTVNTSKFPISGIKVTVSNGKQNYTAESNSKGIIEISGLAEGLYSLKTDQSEYPAQDKGLNIMKGASLCDIVLFNKDEMEAGTGAFNLSLNEYETSAFLTWPGSKATQWIVKYYPTDKPGEVKTLMTTVPKINIEGLKRETSYTVSVAEMDGVIENNFRKVSFKTAKQTSVYPVILVHSMYEKGDVILLKAGNVPDGATIRWEVDGNKVEDIEFPVSGPEHKIELFIKGGEGEEIITKYITVIE